MSKPKLALLTLGLALGQAGQARAGMSFDPVYIHLTQNQPTTILQISNAGDKPMRYQVTTAAWSQGPAGEILTEPTQQIAFFPTVFTLAPHQSRGVRLGAKGGFSDREKTFRIFIEEFAPPGDETSGVQVHARVGLPIFLDPAQARPTAKVEEVKVAHGGLEVRLHSTGNTHLQLLGARAALADDHGKSLHQRSWGSSYLLAGNDLRLSGPLPLQACAEVREVDVEVLTDQGTLKSQLSTPKGVCSP